MWLVSPLLLLLLLSVHCSPLPQMFKTVNWTFHLVSLQRWLLTTFQFESFLLHSHGNTSNWKNKTNPWGNWKKRKLSIAKDQLVSSPVIFLPSPDNFPILLFPFLVLIFMLLFLSSMLFSYIYYWFFFENLSNYLWNFSLIYLLSISSVPREYIVKSDTFCFFVVWFKSLWFHCLFVVSFCCCSMQVKSFCLYTLPGKIPWRKTTSQRADINGNLPGQWLPFFYRPEVKHTQTLMCPHSQTHTHIYWSAHTHTHAVECTTESEYRIEWGVISSYKVQYRNKKNGKSPSIAACARNL